MDDFDDQIKQTTKNPWYAVRTFNCQELKMDQRNNLRDFIFKHII